ncbi:MAG: hydantoinase/oxoprolinase family protein [Gemmatimonadales bacterium]
MPPATCFTGWDIGGVNTKVARVTAAADSARPLRVATRAYEIQRDPERLPRILREMASAIGSGPEDLHAVTMTAELSQFFLTKRAGVSFVLEAVSEALPPENCRVFATDGRFLSLAEAGADPMAVAASNWAATARWVARTSPDALLIDTGSTTTDLIPIVGGEVAALGRTDPERLASGELVYTGAVRTPVEAVAQEVWVRDASVGVSAEGFALTGDVYLWLDRLPEEAYDVPTPDGRPATRQYAGVRLARVICGDREMLEDAEITRIASSIAQAQVRRIGEAAARVRERHPTLREAVVCGLGDFIAMEGAQYAGLRPTRLADHLGADTSRVAPAAAVAMLLAAATASPEVAGARSS